MLRTILLTVVTLAILRSAISAAELKRYGDTRPAMGTKFHIALYAADEATAKAAFDAAFARVAELEKTLSDYDEESEVSRLSAASPTKEPVKLSDDLWRVLERSQFLAEQSGGAFDVTVGPLTKLWRRARRQHELPAAELLAEARKAVGYQNLVLNAAAKTAELKLPHMRLDVGGIGKGFAADEALAVLKRRGISQATVAASGDIAIGDAPPGEAGWTIGVAPIAANGPPSRWLLLANCGVSTSGDTFQFLEIDGKRFSHILDPRTGEGLTEPLIVSVVAPNCTTSDVTDTTLSVLGVEKGLALAEKLPGVAALLVRGVAEKVEVIESSRFKTLTTTKNPQK